METSYGLSFVIGFLQCTVRADIMEKGALASRTRDTYTRLCSLGCKWWDLPDEKDKALDLELRKESRS